MELRQLTYFVAVVDEAHFTRAAERLRIAQPAVSQQIRRLEAELGERLLHRDRRMVTLTSAGEALLPHARAALAQAEYGRQAVAALRGLVTGQLRVGLIMPLPDRRVFRAIGAFGRKYPGIELTLVEDETDALLDGLATSDLHTAFLGFGPGQHLPANMQAIVVAREPGVLAVHPGHALAARESVRLSALRDEPVVTLTRASRLRTVLETECRQAGFAPRIVAETSDLNVMVQLVAEGVGVALMPRSGQEEAGDVVTIAITHPTIERRILLAWRPGATSPAARAFIALAREHLGERAGTT
ncbi:MAG: LysR family transcriptional regulator [Actinobacteria bacterium]|nr:LysR family transcriptional regulator [Actinomycetota bacterium]